ncbi:MAG TPA: glycosyltransferase family 4 protein [Solirubrobacterales bacterium]|jgi:glycosyltransferase involved in cell wall biosynthesis|nr:glycosyltransferase family 4 protein [Solirubrobacterales bacterium]
MEAEPRVLHLGPDPDLGGGMAAAQRALLRSPLAQSYRLEVVATYRGPRPLRRLAVYCAALAHLTWWSLRGRGRVVHVHATVRGSAYRKAVCVLLAKALRRRVVLQVHSGAGDIAAFRAGRGRLSLALLGAAFDRADAVLAVSSASAEALRAAGAGAEIEVVPNAAPPVVVFEREQPAGGEVRLAYLGGFANPAKGGDVLVEALAAALAGEPRLRVTLAGPGEPPPAMTALASREPGVSWAGWLEEGDKDELLRSSQVFVMPSRSEGLPMALLEAMAYGLAVLATEVGGIPEIVEPGVDGLLVAAEEPRALADALVRLGGDPALRERLGEGARRRVERLDAVEVADRLGAIYAALA